jgi:hypothetical protein
MYSLAVHRELDLVEGEAHVLASVHPGAGIEAGVGTGSRRVRRGVGPRLARSSACGTLSDNEERRDDPA